MAIDIGIANGVLLKSRTGPVSKTLQEWKAGPRVIAICMGLYLYYTTEYPESGERIEEIHKGTKLTLGMNLHTTCRHYHSIGELSMAFGIMSQPIHAIVHSRKPYKDAINASCRGLCRCPKASTHYSS